MPRQNQHAAAEQARARPRRSAEGDAGGSGDGLSSGGEEDEEEDGEEEEGSSDAELDSERAAALAELGVVRALFACVVAAALTRLFIGLARRQIGGQTGDVCGAAAALAEAATLLALLMGGRDA